MPSDPALSANRQVRAACSVRYACRNFGYQRTPFGISNARYDLATGRLCYAITAARPCTGCVTRTCRSTTGGTSYLHGKETRG